VRRLDEADIPGTQGGGEGIVRVRYALVVEGEEDGELGPCEQRGDVEGCEVGWVGGEVGEGG
jgi:hypothetical protein